MTSKAVAGSFFSTISEQGFGSLFANLLAQDWFRAAGGWLLLGLGVGVAAKILVPGREQMGWFRTIGLGVVGSALGTGFVGPAFGWGTPASASPQGLALGVGVALVLVVINRVVTQS